MEVRSPWVIGSRGNRICLSCNQTFHLKVTVYYPVHFLAPIDICGYIYCINLCFITNSSVVVYYFLQVWVKTLMVRICKFLHIVHPSAEEAALIPRRSFIIHAPMFQYHRKKYFTTFLNGLWHYIVLKCQVACILSPSAHWSFETCDNFQLLKTTPYTCH